MEFIFMVYIVGDLHGTYGTKKETKFLKSLKKEDILIVLGDFGWTWNSKSIDKFKLKCTTLFIDGNHDNFTILDSLEEKEMFDSKVGVLKENVYHLKRGNIYTIEGKKYFCFGGANSIDKQYRIPYVSWWERELPSMSEYYNAIENLDKNKYNVDFILTHTCSVTDSRTMLRYEFPIKDPTEDMIEEIKKVIDEHKGSYSKHFFGHHHVYGNIGNVYCLYEQGYSVEKNEVLFF